MTWSEEFYQALNNNTDFGSQITGLSYEARPDSKPPFAYYSLVSATGTSDLDGHSDEGERRIQLNIWSNSPTKSEEIAGLAIGPAVKNLNVSNIVERSLGIEEGGLFGYAIDFLIWFQNPRGN